MWAVATARQGGTRPNIFITQPTRSSHHWNRASAGRGVTSTRRSFPCLSKSRLTYGDGTHRSELSSGGERNTHEEYLRRSIVSRRLTRDGWRALREIPADVVPSIQSGNVRRVEVYCFSRNLYLSCLLYVFLPSKGVRLYHPSLQTRKALPPERKTLPSNKTPPFEWTLSLESTKPPLL